MGLFLCKTVSSGIEFKGKKLTNTQAQKKTRPLTYWAFAISVPSPTKPGYWRLDTGFIYLSAENFEPHMKAVEARLPNGEKILDFINISKEVFEAQPQVFVDRDGWVAINEDALKVGGTAA